MFKLIVDADLTEEANLRRVGRKIKKGVFHIRNDVISSNVAKRFISYLILLSLLLYGLSFTVRLSYSKPDLSPKTEETHAIEIDEQAVLRSPATVELPTVTVALPAAAADELQKEVV